jgi:hypothetical protein
LRPPRIYNVFTASEAKGLIAANICAHVFQRAEISRHEAWRIEGNGGGMTLRFEDTDDFKTNLERFLTYMESEDPEMGAILRAHAGSLLDAKDDAARRGARALFNFSVTSELDGLLQKDPHQDAG